MGGRNLIILAIAVVIGIAAVFFANAYFSGVEERQERIAEEQQLRRIVVATQPLEFGTVLSPDNIRLQNFPANSVPEGAFVSIEEALRDGRVALRPVVPGEPILRDKVSGADGRAVLSALLPEGMRAVSVPVSAVSSVSGFVRPNDLVDVILTRQIPGPGATGTDLMADVIMEGVQVLAIDQLRSEDATEPTVGNTAVLLVDLFGAQKLILAQRVGQLSLALRNVEEQEPGQLLTVTARDLGDPAIYLAGNESSPAPAPAPQYIFAPAGFGQGAPAAAPQRSAAPAAPAAPPRPSGPTMSVTRGSDTTEYEVGRMGGR